VGAGALATTVGAGAGLVTAGGVGVDGTGAGGVLGAAGARRRTPDERRRVPVECRSLVLLRPGEVAPLVATLVRRDAAGPWPRAATKMTSCLPTSPRR
jgi:hypothetical protein